MGYVCASNVDNFKLVVYTTKGIKVIDVPFDELFWKSLQEKLVKFYIEKLGPSTLISLTDGK